MRSYYPGITIFKLTGALLVLFAHALLIPLMVSADMSAPSSFLLLTLRVIVPCFYVVSGFLAYKGWSNAADPAAYVKRYVWRIGAVYALFCLLFALQFTVPDLIRNGMGPGNLFLQAKILFMAVFLNGPFLQLWFIPPLLFGVAAAYGMLRTLRVRTVMILAAAGYTLCQLISGSLRGLLGQPGEGWTAFGTKGLQYMEYADLWLTRYIGFGLAFVLAGALLAKYEERFLRLRLRRTLLLAGALTAVEAGLLALLAEWTPEYKLAFSIAPNTLLLFYGVLRLRLPAVQAHHRAISLFAATAFCAHIPLMELNRWLFRWTPSETGIGFGFGIDLLQALLTLAECVALTALIRWRLNAAAGRKRRRQASDAAVDIHAPRDVVGG